jgi:hypothetical protein
MPGIPIVTSDGGRTTAAAATLQDRVPQPDNTAELGVALSTDVPVPSSTGRAPIDVQTAAARMRPPSSMVETLCNRPTTATTATTAATATAETIAAAIIDDFLEATRVKGVGPDLESRFHAQLFADHYRDLYDIVDVRNVLVQLMSGGGMTQAARDGLISAFYAIDKDSHGRYITGRAYHFLGWVLAHLEKANPITGLYGEDLTASALDANVRSISLRRHPAPASTDAHYWYDNGNGIVGWDACDLIRYSFVNSLGMLQNGYGPLTPAAKARLEKIWPE